MRPLVLPLTAIPSARLEAEDTLPPFFILGIGLPAIPACGPIVRGIPVDGPIGGGPPGLGVIGIAGAPVTVGLTTGLAGAAGNGFAGTCPGAYLII